MKFFVFIFYLFIFLSTMLLNTMEITSEKKIKNFQPKSLQEVCIKELYMLTHDHKNGESDEFYSTENINLFNKHLSLKLYPLIAYYIAKTNKIPFKDKNALVCFLRDYPEKHDPKTKKILDFFYQFIEEHYFHSTMLSRAVHHSVKPCIFHFLLKNGEKADASLVWYLIGNEKFRPEIHRYHIKKLAYLLAFNPPLEPKPFNAFMPPAGLQPLEYAQAMLSCWQDERWTNGHIEKQFKNFKPKICEKIPEKTITIYQQFFSKTVALLTDHQNQAMQGV